MFSPVCRLLAVVVAVSACDVGASATRITPSDKPPPALRRRADTVSNVDVAAEVQLLALHNRAREQAGLAPLSSYWDLTDDARAHSAAQRAAGTIFHNTQLASVTVGWTLLGENVGVGPNMQLLHAAFMASPGHRANILSGDYRYAGVGVIGEGGRRWVTVVFMGSDRSGLEKALPPFVDDEGTPFESAIKKIYDAGITNGCGGPPHRRFCPGRTLTRGEMAAFLVRALGLPPSNADRFSDDHASIFEDAINALAAAGITKGCTPSGDRYCPADFVTRGQMAVFLDRALKLSPTAADYFSDDTGRFYEGAANRMRAAGITRGCSATRYCGERSLRRDEMAAFLARALGL